MINFENQFNDMKKQWSPQESGSRQKAFDFFKTQGLPTRKHEDWKYTSLKSFEQMAPQRAPKETSASTVSAVKTLLNPDFFHLVFINGRYQIDLSSQIPGLKISQLPLADSNYEDSLMALNWALSEVPLQLDVAADTVIKKPVQVLFYSSADQTILASPHLDVCLGTGSQLSFIEDYRGEGVYTTNAFVRFVCRANSRLSYVQCQRQSSYAVHVARTHFEIFKGARVESLSFSLGASLSRHNQKFFLKELEAWVKSLGLYVVSKDQHSDHSGLIDHEVGQCTSYQIYKGLLKDQGHGVFNGRVWIRKNSQKAFSEQVNKNLLLSTGAEIDSKPQLEIEADDVQARHGSTVGQVNAEELFYLMSRGISKTKALPMISFGFLAEILSHLSEDSIIFWLRGQLEDVLKDIHLEDA